MQIPPKFNYARLWGWDWRTMLFTGSIHKGNMERWLSRCKNVTNGSYTWYFVWSGRVSEGKWMSSDQLDTLMAHTIIVPSKITWLDHSKQDRPWLLCTSRYISAASQPYLVAAAKRTYLTFVWNCRTNRQIQFIPMYESTLLIFTWWDIPIPTKSLLAVLIDAGMKANFISPNGVLPRAWCPCPKRAIPL